MVLFQYFLLVLNMACCERWEVICCVLFVVLRIINIECEQTDRLGLTSPAPEFGKYSVFKPRIYHGRDEREVKSTREDKDSLIHLHHITVVFGLDGKQHILDLRLNRDLISKNYFVKHQHNGTHIITRPSENETELCHYHGKVRGVENSWVAVSTCSGLRGMFYDGESLHYIERENNEDKMDFVYDNDHYHYSHQDLIANFSCGYSGTEHNHITDFQSSNRILRHKRSPEVIRGPYNANKQSRYVELVFVVDNKEYKALGENINRVNSHCKDIANIINSLYVPLNIFIALVGVVVWTEIDEIALSPNGDTTLTNFLHYRRERLVKDHPNDNAQLLTRVPFEGGVVGKALKGPICTFEFSGGVSMDHSAVVGLVATTVAHEMGHNFGMEHDVHECKCPDDRCIMAPSSSSMSPTHWSSCSLDYLSSAFERGMDYCLRNKPERLFDSPVCGNGYVEAGEQCDCGLNENCDNPCCNVTSCMLYSNASCATGECCDLKICRPKTAGSICRSADHECDLPEFCTGQSEFCPSDVFKMDGEKCDRGGAFCYQGSCRTHSDQCKLLWGPSGKSSDIQCYNLNKKGSRHGNCGYIRLNQSFIKCDDGDIQCGMLHCIHLNERLEFGMESVAILSHSFINSGGSIIPCRTAIVDLGLNQVDPGLAPNGAKCGEDKMCVNQRCITVQAVQAMASVDSCPQQCNNNGICNSKGHCHCRSGFSPPYCDYPGTGGSEDSGPASDPNARREVITALYIIFLGIVPFFSLVALFTYYMRRNPVFFRKKAHFAVVEKKTTNPRSSRDKGPGNGPVPSDHSQTSLLSQPETSKAPSSDGSPVPSYLQSNLFGHYKGFSITPLPKQSFSSCTSSSSNLIPTRSAPSMKPVTNSQPVSPPKVPSVAIPYPTRSAPKVPPSNIGLSVNNIGQPCLMDPAPSRPDISSPVLDMTTSCTAKELIDKSNLPVRPAPAVPVKDKPRPLSSPNINYIINMGGNKAKPKDSVYPTLTRLASFMIRGQKNIDDKDHSTKSNKMDRDVLRSLEISNPIPQKEINIPSNSLPAGEKVVVMRAQSLRDSSSTEKRRPIPTFGSMRVPNVKRPTSIPVGNRPSSPPPPRPPAVNIQNFQSSGKLENTYDDCLNLLTEGVGPLADIDEESPTNPVDNIYATIEESPTDRRERKEIILPTKLEYTSPVGNKSPKGIENSESVGSDSMGLLGEIVSEIEARNMDSIYSASTLKNKKDKDDETNTDMSIDIDSNNITYVNTPWCSMFTTPSASSSSSSSGYLSPINPVQGNKRDVRRTVTVQIPETSAPSHKPYLQKNSEPLSAATLSKTEVSQKLPPNHKSFLNTKTKLLDNKISVMSTNNIKSPTETNLIRVPNNSKPSSESSLRSTLNNNFPRPSSGGLSLTKPDVVSSCATTPGAKSPDVLECKVENKSNHSKPNAPSLRRVRNPSPNPNVVSTIKGSITNQPLPAIPSKANVSDTKTSSLKQNQPEPKLTPTKPAVNKQSNVASLQQKFEQGKGSLKSTKPQINTKPSAMKNSKPFNVKR